MAMSHTPFLPIVFICDEQFLCAQVYDLELWFICGLCYLNATVQEKYDKHLRSSHSHWMCSTWGLSHKISPARCHIWLSHTLLLNIIYPIWSIKIIFRVFALPFCVQEEVQTIKLKLWKSNEMNIQQYERNKNIKFAFYLRKYSTSRHIFSQYPSVGFFCFSSKLIKLRVN